MFGRFPPEGGRRGPAFPQLPACARGTKLSGAVRGLISIVGQR